MANHSIAFSCTIELIPVIADRTDSSDGQCISLYKHRVAKGKLSRMHLNSFPSSMIFINMPKLANFVLNTNFLQKATSENYFLIKLVLGERMDQTQFEILVRVNLYEKKSSQKN